MWFSKDLQKEPALLSVTGVDLPPGPNTTSGVRSDASVFGFGIQCGILRCKGVPMVSNGLD